MISKYHQNIQKGIILFGKHKKVKIKGGPIPLIHPAKKIFPILYRPDVVFVSKLNKLHIFEILDSELKNENLIIADIILSFLSPNVSTIYFIVPSEKDQDKVLNLATIIAARLSELGIPRKKKTMRVFYITKTEARSPRCIEKLMKKAIKLRGKFV
jgi:hypothetical protein